MDESEFGTKAEALLRRLFEAIDATLGDFLEVDLQSGILEISLPGDGGTYVINRHSASREVWVSSPRSGAWHFRPQPDGAWRATRGGSDAPMLAGLLSDELSAATGRSFSLEA
jgi:frataxin